MTHTYIVNSEPFTLTQAANQGAIITVSQLLSEYFLVNHKPQLFAVAVNQTFVAKEQYASTPLTEGAVIELFSPIQGG